MTNRYDIVVVGGGTAGISCAWNAAKLGFKTLIIEKNSYLGGSITSSLVIPAMKTSDNSINNIFYNELYKNLEEINGAITYSDGNKGWFNPELTKIVLDKMLTEANVDIIFEAAICDVIPLKNKILSADSETIYNYNILLKSDEILLSPIETIYLVDATGDAKICEKLNVNFLDNTENFSQPRSLRFIMSGIDINKFSAWLLAYDNNKEITTSHVIGDSTYLSTAYTWDNNIKWALKPLFERAIADKIITEADSNYFQLFSVAGTRDSIAFNAPRLLDNTVERSKAYIDARSSIFRLSIFCKKYLPGFENAYISNIANTLGIRESRRIRGKYIYTYNDLITGKKFKNPVLISNYPVDVHSIKKDTSILEKTLQEYQLPIESLIVADYDNLFVAGRCVSAEFKAQAAIRIIPSCFSMGEGLAKYLYELKN